MDTKNKKYFEAEKRGEKTIVGPGGDNRNLTYEFNSYTKHYLNIAKYLINTILADNNVQNTELKQPLQNLLDKITRSGNRIIEGSLSPDLFK